MKNFITGFITAGVVVYVALIYHSTGMLYCAVWIVCFLLLLLGFHLLFFRKLRFSFDKITETVASGEQMTLAVLAQNRCFLPSGRIRIVVEAYHVLNDTTGEIIIDCMLPGGLQRRSAQPIRIRGEWTPSYPGGVYFRLVSVRHYDYFGFTSIGVSRRNLDQSEVLAVLPVYHEIGISAGVKYHTQHLEQEGDDSTSMEKNPPEVSEIREYRPGDRMHNIHWKLSAKRDEIMVYEFISEQNIMPVIYLAPVKDTEQLLAYITFLFSLSIKLLQKGCAHILVYCLEDAVGRCKIKDEGDLNDCIALLRVDMLVGSRDIDQMRIAYQDRYGQSQSAEWILSDKECQTLDGEEIAEFALEQEGRKRDE